MKLNTHKQSIFFFEIHKLIDTFPADAHQYADTATNFIVSNDVT